MTMTAYTSRLSNKASALVSANVLLGAMTSFAQLTSNTIAPAGVRIERAVEFLAPQRTEKADLSRLA